MDTKDTLSAIRGVPVVSLDTGANLGYVAQVYVDPQTRKLSAVSFKNRKQHGETYVESDDITLLGQDVILIRSEAAAQRIDPAESMGRQLMRLRGLPVTTREGQNLGKLVDFDIRHDDRVLTELHLANGQRLPIEAAEVAIGPDAVIVPACYVDRVVHASDERGFFERVRHWRETHRRRHIEAKDPAATVRAAGDGSGDPPRPQAHH